MSHHRASILSLLCVLALGLAACQGNTCPEGYVLSDQGRCLPADTLDGGLDADAAPAPDADMDRDASDAADLDPDADVGDATSALDDAGAEADATRDSGCVLVTHYADVDGDSWGDSDVTIDSCEPPVGYVDRAGDCDDQHAEALPGGVEVCDGLDNDCDGVIDQALTRACGSDVGACVAGTQSCAAGAWGACEGEVGAAAETCDGVQDENCDGSVDEGCACTSGDTRSCGSDVGACALGTQTCVAGGWVACTGSTEPRAEVCDGVDNDCDGSVDDGDPEGGTSCGSSVGACVAGRLHCIGGSLVCQGMTGPHTEICDGVDNDCNGSVDEGVQTRFYIDEDGDGHGASSDTGVLACAVPSGRVSSDDDCDDAHADTYAGAPEVCDGRDNDCDTWPDQSFYCVRGTTVSCATTCGGDVGSGTCTASCQIPNGASCAPPVEGCNYADDDCDGVVDESFSTVSGPVDASDSDHLVARLVPYRDGFLAFSSTNTGSGLYVRKLDLDGVPVGSVIDTITTGTLTAVDATTTNPNGTSVIVAWAEDSGTSQAIYAMELVITSDAHVVTGPLQFVSSDGSDSLAWIARSTVRLLAYRYGTSIYVTQLSASLEPVGVVREAASDAAAYTPIAARAFDHNPPHSLAYVSQVDGKLRLIKVYEDASSSASLPLSDDSVQDRSPSLALLAPDRMALIYGHGGDVTARELSIAAGRVTVGPRIYLHLPTATIHGGNFIAGAADGGRLFVSYLSPSGTATQWHLRVFDDSAWTPLDAWDDEVGSPSVPASRNYLAVTTATRAGHAIFGAAPLGLPSLSRHYGCP